MIAFPKSSRRLKTLVAAAASLAVHLALIAALVWSVRPAHPPQDASPGVMVNLIPWIASRINAAARPERPLVVPRRMLASPRGPAPVPTPPAPPKALEPDAPIDPRLAAQEAVRGALQASVRCGHPDDFKLDAAGRERCRQLFHDQGKDAPAYAVDPADHARHDPPVASHGMALVNHLSPRPGAPLSPPAGCEHAWRQNCDLQPGPNIP